jgi:hypothetical protein
MLAEGDAAAGRIDVIDPMDIVLIERDPAR